MGLLKALPLALCMLAFSAGPAHADPITATITAVAAAFGGGVVATIAATAIVGGALVGATLLTAQALAPNIPDTAQQGNTIPGRSATESYKHVIGQTLVAGDTVREHSSGDDNEWFFESRALAYGPIESIEEIRINNTVITPLGTGNANDGYPVTVSPYGGEIAYFTTGLGGSAEAVDGMAQAWGGADSNYDHKPFAYLNFRLIIDDVWAGQVPQITAVIKGEKIYDPRDLAQDPDDPSTWEWSDNPALIAAWYVMQPYSFNEPSDRIDWEGVTAAANICDELVPTDTAATEKRYRCNGMFTEEQDRLKVLQSIVVSMAGDFVQPKSTGKWQFFAGAYEAPEVDIEERHILKSSYQPVLPSSERYTVVRGNYVSAAKDYQPEDYPEVSSAIALAEEGGVELEHEAKLIFVQSPTQAQRIASIILERSRLQKTFKVDMNAAGQVLTPGKRATYTDKRYGVDQEVFRVMNSDIEDIGTSVTLRENRASVYDPPILRGVADGQAITLEPSPLLGGGGGVINQPTIGGITQVL